MRTPSVRRPTLLLLLGVLGVASLGACGQKGPLYLPDPAAQPAEPAPADDKDDKKKDETPPDGARRPR
jgi:predicted small lipoprotein YifL